MFTDDRSRFSTATGLAPEFTDASEPEGLRSDLLDDVFGDDSDNAHANIEHTIHRESASGLRSNDVSDVPRLQGIHTTNGYREGVASSKENFLQEGFDEGYSLGAEIGVAAGKIVGLLEALAVAMRPTSAEEVQRAEVVDTLARARSELSAKSLYAKEYFGEDGIWKYEVAGSNDVSQEEDSVTFRVVASNHPLVRKWQHTVDELLDMYGLKSTALWKN